jgi:drug/metabolite transporter (DMT)-like permease
MPSNTKIQGYSIIILAVFTWSFSEVIVKLLQQKIGPLALSFFRFFIGGIFLLIILLFKKDLSGFKKLLKENWKFLIISSCFALGISNVIYFMGVRNTQANIAATIYSTYPIWITIYSILLLQEKNNLKLKFIGLSIGIFGVIILMTNFNFIGLFESEYLFGNVLVLLGSILWGLYSVLGKRIQINEKNTTNIPLKFSFISSLLACLPIFVILIFTSEFQNFGNYDIQSWAWIFFLGIISTGLGIFLLFEGIKRLEVSKGMSLAFLKPIFATILAFFILKEIPTLSLYISVGMIIISIVLINKNPKIKKSDKNGNDLKLI